MPIINHLESQPPVEAGLVQIQEYADQVGSVSSIQGTHGLVDPNNLWEKAPDLVKEIEETEQGKPDRAVLRPATSPEMAALENLIGNLPAQVDQVTQPTVDSSGKTFEMMYSCDPNYGVHLWDNVHPSGNDMFCEGDIVGYRQTTSHPPMYDEQLDGIWPRPSSWLLDVSVNLSGEIKGIKKGDGSLYLFIQFLSGDVNVANYAAVIPVNDYGRFNGVVKVRFLLMK